MKPERVFCSSCSNIIRRSDSGGWIHSLTGRIGCKDSAGNYTLQELCTPIEEKGGELRTVFENSSMYNLQTFDNIQKRLHGDSLLNIMMAA